MPHSGLDLLKLIVPSIGSSTQIASAFGRAQPLLLAEKGDPGIGLGEHLPHLPLDLDVDRGRVVAIALVDHRSVVGAAATDELGAQVDGPLGREQGPGREP